MTNAFSIPKLAVRWAVRAARKGCIAAARLVGKMGRAVKLLLVALEDKAGADLVCKPAMSTLGRLLGSAAAKDADAARYARVVVAHARDVLGVLKVLRPGGGRTTNRYWIDYDALAALSPAADKAAKDIAAGAEARGDTPKPKPKRPGKPAKSSRSNVGGSPRRPATLPTAVVLASKIEEPRRTLVREAVERMLPTTVAKLLRETRWSNASGRERRSAAMLRLTAHVPPGGPVPANVAELVHAAAKVA